MNLYEFENNLNLETRQLTNCLEKIYVRLFDIGSTSKDNTGVREDKGKVSFSYEAILKRELESLKIADSLAFEIREAFLFEDPVAVDSKEESRPKIPEISETIKRFANSIYKKLIDLRTYFIGVKEQEEKPEPEQLTYEIKNDVTLELPRECNILCNEILKFVGSIKEESDTIIEQEGDTAYENE